VPQALSVEGPCETLVGLPDEVWSESMRRQDSLSGLIDAKHYLELFRECSADGRRTARSVSKRLAASDPEGMLRELGVTVEDMAHGSLSYGQQAFALFVEPDLVMVDEGNASRTQELIAESGLDALLGDVSVRDVLLAHELYHVVALGEDDPDRPCMRRVVETRGIGPLKRKSRLSSLQEVSAMAFAEGITGLTCSPYVLTVLMMVPRDASAAEREVQRLLSISSELSLGGDAGQ
jgi:hypothetical protein